MNKIEITFTDGTTETIKYFDSYETRGDRLIIRINYHTGEKIIYPFCSIKKFEIKGI
jgi:hypothetical protein